MLISPSTKVLSRQINSSRSMLARLQWCLYHVIIAAWEQVLQWFKAKYAWCQGWRRNLSIRWISWWLISRNRYSKGGWHLSATILSRAKILGKSLLIHYLIVRRHKPCWISSSHKTKWLWGRMNIFLSASTKNIRRGRWLQSRHTWISWPVCAIRFPQIRPVYFSSLAKQNWLMWNRRSWKPCQKCLEQHR